MRADTTNTDNNQHQSTFLQVECQLHFVDDLGIAAERGVSGCQVVNLKSAVVPSWARGPSTVHFPVSSSARLLLFACANHADLGSQVGHPTAPTPNKEVEARAESPVLNRYP
jgi:hypothetical protein